MLEIEQIKKLIENGQMSNVSALTFQRRLQGHANTESSDTSNNDALKQMFKLAEALLTKDKVEILRSITLPPLDSNAVVNEVYTILSAVLNPRNATETLTASEGLKNSAENWLEEKKIRQKFKTDSWEAFKTAPNCLMVIDAPEEGGDPYVSFVDITSLFAWKFKHESNMLEYALIKDSELLYRFFDDQKTVIFKREKEGDEFIITKIKQFSGRCLVNFFWTTQANSYDKAVKLTPVMSQLSNLDFYNFISASFDDQITTSIFPILTVLEQACINYETFDTPEADRVPGGLPTYNVYCDNGKINGKPCPECSGKKLSGASVVLTKPVPKDGQPDITEPVTITAPPINDVIFTKQHIRDLEADIKTAITGKQSDVSEKVAINKQQVTSNKNNHETILKNIAWNLSNAKTWAIETLLRFNYSTTAIDYVANEGTEFFTYTEAELVTLYAEAKTAGMPESYLKSIERELEDLRNSSNEAKKMRSKLLNAITPYQSLDIETVANLGENAVLEKILFGEFLKEFELTNGNIESYMQDSEFNLIANNIKKEFSTFVNNFKTKNNGQTTEREFRSAGNTGDEFGNEPANAGE